MGIFTKYYRMGLGTSRLPISGPNDKDGIEKSTDLILKALDMGINYIDTSYPYSAGMAHTALKAAFAKTDKPYSVTVKVMYDMDKTADEAIRRVEFQLESMGIDSAEFFVCWTIPSYEVFCEITRKGGVYDGALKLKNDGRIKHICGSLHAPQADSIKIIESGAFEGLTISHSLLSAIQSLPILDAALSKNTDVAVMNPLGGGVIAQNADFFAFARSEGEDTVTAAMRFVSAHPAVKVILSGLNNEQELFQNIVALEKSTVESDTDRIKRVVKSIKNINGFCVNCHYCDDCPQGIPVSSLMNGRNNLLFGNKHEFNRADPELAKNISLFYEHSQLGTNPWLPDSTENPCIRCGKCMESCTQKLNIIDGIEDTYLRAKKSGYSLQDQKKRLEELLIGKAYHKVGLYPNGGFANKVMAMYNQFWDDQKLEWFQFNSDPKMWRQTMGGIQISPPDSIPSLNLDLIIVCTYRYDQEIYRNLEQYRDKGVEIVKLHRDTDVPWVF